MIQATTKFIRSIRRQVLAAALCAAAFVCAARADVVSEVPEDFPRFIVTGHEPAMTSLRKLYWLHYRDARPLIPLWDEWMSMATLWPAREASDEQKTMRLRWAVALTGRQITPEGYVHTHQHDGPAHADGWPFPGWHIAGGVGWHFRGTGIAGYDLPTVTEEHWGLHHATSAGIDDKGWVVELTAPQAMLTRPSFTIEAVNSPWLRLNWWATGLQGADPYVEWTTAEHPEFSADRRMYFSPAVTEQEHRSLPMGGGGGKIDTSRGETRTMIPVYRVPTWKGTITQFRIGFDNPGPAKVVIKSFHTAPDTRHNVNNLNFIRGVQQYFVWSRDVGFLRHQIARVRTAMRFTMRDFDTRRRNCIYTTWPGHEGRSGVRYVDGQKQIIPGQGIGSNYWDLLPFGGEDALATIYYYDTLLDLAELEAQIAKHPQWNVATGADAFDPDDLRQHAQAVKDYGTQRFWNASTGRFGTIDLDGNLHDYGWTFLNNEAIYYDFATADQARSIRDWISGRRTVEGDTSAGADIYHWRFGPRSSTLRNIEYYFWGWSAPESIPFGYQVQDGGAVFGFSFHDLMARLKVDGPDDAWNRLKAILQWFDETQADGGYRAYYGKDPERGSMQGGNVAGGLGIDKEFFESILVPQVMLYGFLGFEPTPTGFKINPRLPKDWPDAKITRIRLHDRVLNVRATAEGIIEVESESSSSVPIVIELPGENWTTDAAGAAFEGSRVSLQMSDGAVRFSRER